MRTSVVVVVVGEGVFVDGVSVGDAVVVVDGISVVLIVDGVVGASVLGPEKSLNMIGESLQKLYPTIFQALVNPTSGKCTPP